MNERCRDRRRRRAPGPCPAAASTRGRSIGRAAGRAIITALVYWERIHLSGFAWLGLSLLRAGRRFIHRPSRAPLSKPLTIAIGVWVIVGGWLIYDALCEASSSGGPAWLAAVLAPPVQRRGLDSLPNLQRGGRLSSVRARCGTNHGGEVFFVFLHHTPGRANGCGQSATDAIRILRAGLRGKVRSGTTPISP